MIKKIKFIIIPLLIIVSCIAVEFLIDNIFHDHKTNKQYYSNNVDSFTYNDDGTVTLGLGMVANGFYDKETNKIIDSGSLLRPINGNIQGQVSFKQNISERRNYLLIVMIDYIQHDFIVDDTTYSTYPFSLEGEEGIRINVDITNLKFDEHEFCYFIIPEPQIDELSIDNSSEWNKLLMTSSFYTWRLLLNDSSEYLNTHKYNESTNRINSQVNYGIQLAKTHQEVSAMPSCTSMENVELIISNVNDFDMKYILVAFLDWKQVPMYSDMTELITIPSKSTIYMDLKIPIVKEDTPYQIFAVPSPFTNDIKFSIPPSCTLRTIISPEE